MILFHEEKVYDSYDMLGAHVMTEHEIEGTRFSVWAPHAKMVSVVGDFNEWDDSKHVMERMTDEGVWSLFIAGIGEHTLYKYAIETPHSHTILKADPYATYAEVRPNTASVVYNINGYTWHDQKWMKKKQHKSIYNEPLSIYEMHFGTWKKKEDGALYSYREMADDVIPYVAEHGFTHIEIMPLIEHPYDRSWGYQGTGYYAVTSRYGTPEDFMYFVDECHKNGIGVILDWVPGHFCKDEHGLYLFDGEPTYEYRDIDVQENRVWGTVNFDLGKQEVRNFLISNALFWMKYYHIDGFRVDAVANMLYWEKEGQQQSNEYAISFLQQLNEAVFAEDETFLMTAEDSTAWPLVTAPTYDGGLGFNYKWNMGWMNDVLKYMECAPEYRKYIHDKMTFSLLYTYSENFILPLSHDEVVHGKKSLLNKMPGSYWEKFAQLRLLYGYFFTHPGKKLLFMGGEFGQFDEWKDLEDLDWELHDFEMHRYMHDYFKELIALYKRSKPLWQLDHKQEGFQWIDADNREQSIFSFIRKGEREEDILVVVCNFTNAVYENYKVGVPQFQFYNEILNSDGEGYGGSGKINKKRLKTIMTAYHNQPAHVEITIPPYGISILRPVKTRKGSTKQDGTKANVCSDVTSRGKR